MGFLFLFTTDHFVADQGWTVQRIGFNLAASVIGNIIGTGMIYAWQHAGDEK